MKTRSCGRATWAMPGDLAVIYDRERKNNSWRAAWYESAVADSHQGLQALEPRRMTGLFRRAMKAAQGETGAADTRAHRLSAGCMAKAMAFRRWYLIAMAIRWRSSLYTMPGCRILEALMGRWKTRFAL